MPRQSLFLTGAAAELLGWLRHFLTDKPLLLKRFFFIYTNIQFMPILNVSWIEIYILYFDFFSHLNVVFNVSEDSYSQNQEPESNLVP